LRSNIDDLSYPDLNIELLDSDKSKFHNTYFSSDSDSEFVFNGNHILGNKFTILKLLDKWAVNESITLSALSALLKVLKSHNCFEHLPMDTRTLLKVNKNTDQNNKIQSIKPGLYHHFGIENGLKSCYENLVSTFDEKIKLVIGIDGLPLSKSSSSTFWPIVGYARHSYCRPHVFLIGLYWGKEKPENSNLFLKDLVDELKILSKTGMQTAFGKKVVVVDTFCCDVPAKSFILFTKGHTGYFSCSRYMVGGDCVENTTCFLGTNFSKRTHLDSINRIDDEHHVSNNVSILLTQVPHIDMISDMSFDYMHLLCLGVVKKLIMLWLGIFKKSPVLVHLQNQNVNIISNHLLSIKQYISCDFP